MQRITITDVLFFALIAQVLYSTATADVLFESGTLGPTGVTWNELTNGTIPSTSVNSTVFPGVRFHLNQSVVTTRVGGHFVGPIGG